MLLGYSSLPLERSPRGQSLHQTHRMPTCPTTTAALFPPERFLAVRSWGRAAKYSICERSRQRAGDSHSASVDVERTMEGWLGAEEATCAGLLPVDEAEKAKFRDETAARRSRGRCERRFRRLRSARGAPSDLGNGWLNQTAFAKHGLVFFSTACSASAFVRMNNASVLAIALQLLAVLCGTHKFGRLCSPRAREKTWPVAWCGLHALCNDIAGHSKPPLA